MLGGGLVRVPDAVDFRLQEKYANGILIPPSVLNKFNYNVQMTHLTHPMEERVI
jgi:hypothetical protein